MIIKMTTGEKIKFARQKKDIKQSVLAKRIGVCQNTLYLYESDQVMVATKVLPALCQELGISADYLLDITFLNTNIESSD